MTCHTPLGRVFIVCSPFTCAATTPTVAQLRYLSNEARGVAVKIIEEVQKDWRALSDHLQLPDLTVGNLEEFSNERACRTVFVKWLNGEGRGPKNWYTVMNVLTAMNYRTVAEKIPHIFGIDC